MNFLFRSIAEGSCLLNLDASNMEEIIDAAIDFLVQTGRLPESQKAMVSEGLKRGEKNPHRHRTRLRGATLL